MTKSRLRKAVATIAIGTATLVGTVMEFEGFVGKVYDDIGGVKTIGYGHTGSDVKSGQTVTRQEAKDILVKDLRSHWEGIRRYIKEPLYQHEAEAYTSFAYNVGVGNFAKSTLLKKLNKGDYVGACNELTKWVYVGKKKVAGLVKRREAERKMCLGE